MVYCIVVCAFCAVQVRTMVMRVGEGQPSVVWYCGVLGNTNVELPFVGFSMNVFRFFLLHHYELLVDRHLVFFMHSLLLVVGVLRTHVSVLCSVSTPNCRLNHTCSAKRSVA